MAKRAKRTKRIDHAAQAEALAKEIKWLNREAESAESMGQAAHAKALRAKVAKRLVQRQRHADAAFRESR